MKNQFQIALAIFALIILIIVGVQTNFGIYTFEPTLVNVFPWEVVMDKAYPAELVHLKDGSALTITSCQIGDYDPNLDREVTIFVGYKDDVDMNTVVDIFYDNSIIPNSGDYYKFRCWKVSDHFPDPTIIQSMVDEISRNVPGIIGAPKLVVYQHDLIPTDKVEIFYTVDSTGQKTFYDNINNAPTGAVKTVMVNGNLTDTTVCTVLIYTTDETGRRTMYYSADDAPVGATIECK